MRIHRTLLCVGLLLLFAGCDTAGIFPLATPLDVSVNCGRSTWVRSTDTGTEIFLFGTNEPALPTDDPEELNEDGEPIGEPCFIRAFVEHDSTAVVEQGSYVLDESGNGTFTVDRSYSFLYQPDESLGNRQGSEFNDSPEPSEFSIRVEEDGEQLLVSVDGEARRLTSFFEVISRLDPTTQEGADDIFRVFNLPLFTSQARINGFGSVRMSQYNNSQSEFTALVRNLFSVLVTGIGARTVIAYDDFEDLTGVTIRGDQITIITALVRGDGHMEGVLDFEMRDGPSPLDVALTGGLDYSNLEIRGGMAGGGSYTLIIDGHGEHVVSWELASDIDLRRVLPVESP